MLESETHLDPMPTASRVALSSRHKTTAPHLRAADVVIPEKLYFRIGEVAQLCRLPAYVLRFWRPSSRTSNRLRAAPASACIATRTWRVSCTSSGCFTRKASPLRAPASNCGWRARPTRSRPRCPSPARLRSQIPPPGPERHSRPSLHPALTSVSVTRHPEAVAQYSNWGGMLERAAQRVTLM